MKVIGITGGSGAGKSTIVEIWRSTGLKVFNADSVYHELLRERVALLAELQDHFGGVFSGGRLDRKKLADIVFSDPAELKKLNSITHKYVVEEIRKRLSGAAAQGETCAAIEAIYLIETELSDLCDCVVGVVAPMDRRLKRIAARDGLGPERAWARVHAQQSDEYFFQNCDYVIDNQGKLEDLEKNAREVLSSILRSG